MPEITFEVEGLPPLKGEAKSLLSEGHGQAPRVLELLKAAAAVIGSNFEPWTEAIGLEVNVQARDARVAGDASNQLGGIGDVLQQQRSSLIGLDHLGALRGVALFKNDAQIAQIRYTRTTGSPSRYRVRVWTLEDDGRNP